MPGGFKQPLRNVSTGVAEIGSFCNYAKLFFAFFRFSCVCTVLDHLFWVRFGALEKYYVLLRLVCLHCGSRFDELPQDCFVVLCLIVQQYTFLSAIASSVAPLCPMTGWVCQWKPFWIPVEDSLKKAYLEEWVFISDAPSEGPRTAEDPMVHNTDHSEDIPVTPRASKHSTSQPWETAKPQDKACFW